MRHHSFMRWASATMAALMFFQCTAPVAFAADDAILAESSIAVSSADSESVPADSDAGYIPEKSPENTSVDSSSNDAASSEPLTGDSSASSDLPEDASSNGSVESQPESDTDQISTSDEIIDSELAESSSENTDESAKSLYQDGKILIYTYDQLAEIGSGQTLTDASGLAVTDENGAEITYALDAQYAIAEDIELTDDMLQWQLPEGFAGSITPLAESSDDLTLYDAQSDTIYLYNPYQMTVLHGENPDTEPVMDGDAQAETFGSGQLIYPNGESEPYLTYSLNHRYILSRQFCSDTSVQPYSVVTDGKADGRDFPGQVIKELNGKTYILIGNEQQLRAIGTDAVVYGAIYQAYLRLGKWYVDNGTDGKPIVLYGGDADLTKDQNGRADFTFGEIRDTDKNLSVESGIYTRGKCGVDQKTGQPNPNLDIKDQTKQKYSANANYIIFRDIDLSKDGVNSNKEDDLWTPLMVSGDIKGAKLADGQATLTDGNSILATGKPVISNVNVNQTEEMDGSKYIGIGFFGTVTNEVNVNNIGVSAGTVSVSNLELQNVNVQNNTNKHKNTQTIISGLTSGLGWLVGGVVDLLVGVLTFGNVNLNLKDTLSALLNARAKDPTIYAAGAFAGRLVGDVSIENCDVTGKVSVSNINDRTGGFVGYTEGVTEYDGLSKALGVTVNALSSLLNAIPGLGLGDLITILLDNALPVGSLIPTGYKNVNIKYCHVENLAGTIGAADKDYAGGFVGQQVGTRIFDCSVKNSSYSVTAKEYGGGFAGISRDAEIRGLLSDVGVELIRVMQPQSILLNCNLTGCNVSVSGENYQGGIVGAQANSYAVNCGASGSIAVKASGSYAGGVSGISTVGWITNLGNKEVKDASLLTTVKDLLTGLLSSDPEKAGMLLSLVGIAPSAILGCNMDCSSVSVEAGKSYSGGILGGGDGVYIAESSPEYLNKLPYWKHGGGDASSVAQRDNVLTGLKTVTASENRAGGIAGSVTTANVTGLLNNTLGIGNFLGFTVHHITVTGVNDGYTVEAKENYAGGALGEAVGGDVDTVTLNQVKSVTAKNRVGGFIGCAGPGDLAGGNGLTLNLLGLNNLLKVENLLSVAEGVRVKINEAHVNGITGGMTVEATGTNSNGEVVDYTAGGFIGKSNSCEIIKSDVKNLKEVTANDTDGFAGGFVGSSQTGGLADVAGEADVKALLNANKLLGAVTYLLPSYTECTVTYVDKGGVAADTAGGFAGNFQSGTVNNQGAGEGNYYSVYNLATY